MSSLLWYPYPLISSKTHLRFLSIKFRSSYRLSLWKWKLKCKKTHLQLIKIRSLKCLQELKRIHLVKPRLTAKTSPNRWNPGSVAAYVHTFKTLAATTQNDNPWNLALKGKKLICILMCNTAIRLQSAWAGLQMLCNVGKLLIYNPDTKHKKAGINQVKGPLYLSEQSFHFSQPTKRCGKQNPQLIKLLLMLFPPY